MCQSDSQPPAPMNDTPTSPAERVDDGAEASTPLPPVMRQWKSDVFRGAAAADQASQRLFEWLNDRGQGGRADGGLTRAALLAVDPAWLKVFLDDLRDLQEQAEYAVEAMEAVMVAVDENDQNAESDHDQVRHS
jgi:hypothetical protein